MKKITVMVIALNVIVNNKMGEVKCDLSYFIFKFYLTDFQVDGNIIV